MSIAEPSSRVDVHKHASAESHPAKVGLIAGWGRYPLVVAGALRAQGTRVYCLGIKDHVDPSIRELCDEFDWIGLGQIGRVIRFFRRHGVTQATMAGKVHKVTLKAEIGARQRKETP